MLRRGEFCACRRSLRYWRIASSPCRSARRGGHLDWSGRWAGRGRARIGLAIPYPDRQSRRAPSNVAAGGGSVSRTRVPAVTGFAFTPTGFDCNLVFVSIRKTYPMQAYKIMHGLWGMGQMMFTKYIIVVDADVDVHNTSEVLFRLCANTDPQRDSIFTKGPSDVLDHATSEIASGSKLGIDATKKIPGEGFKRPWPPLIKMDAAVKAKVEKLFNL